MYTDKKSAMKATGMCTEIKLKEKTTATCTETLLHFLCEHNEENTQTNSGSASQPN